MARSIAASVWREDYGAADIFRLRNASDAPLETFSGVQHTLRHHVVVLD